MRSTTRTVTALFTDLVGSTDMLAKLGATASEVVRAEHFGRMRDALAVHRGQEVKTLGDGFMAVFDSAADALACAVTMQQAVSAHNRRQDGPDLGLRVGIGAGEVTVESSDYFGMPIVEASRLCAAAEAGQILTADVVRILVGDRTGHHLEPVGPMMLKGLPGPTVAWQVVWDADEDFTLRVAIADDSVLLREGIARVLEAEGLDVVLEAADADALLRGLATARPHVVLVDVRMPPTHTVEGLEAAEQIRADHPEIGVIVLSASVETRAAERLLADSTDGVGYLLKERVGDIGELTAAIRAVASGGSAIDPEVVARLGQVASTC
jgi:class 3 adenylate cyclase/CheY-like chemotaxis protein